MESSGFDEPFSKGSGFNSRSVHHELNSIHSTKIFNTLWVLGQGFLTRCLFDLIFLVKVS